MYKLSINERIRINSKLIELVKPNQELYDGTHKPFDKAYLWNEIGIKMNEFSNLNWRK